VTGPETFAAAAKAGGDVILSPGHYGERGVLGVDAIRLRPLLPGTVSFDSLRMIGCKRVVVEGIRFTGGREAEGWGRSPSESQLLIEENRTWPGAEEAEVVGCTFTGLGMAPWRWISGVQIKAGRRAVIRDCLADGVYVGFTVSNGGSAEVTGCTVRRFLGDGIRAMNIPGRLDATIRGNLIVEPWSVNEWGTHRDGIQVGTFADKGGYQLNISGNVIVIGGPAEGQGIYLDDCPHLMTGRVVRNIVVSGAPHGIATWRCGPLSVAGNVVATECSAPRPTNREGARLSQRHPKDDPRGSAIFFGNAARGLFEDGVKGEVEFPGHRRIRHYAEPGDPESYEAVFRGKFIRGEWGPVWDAPSLDAEGSKRWAMMARQAFALR
jgi:hypothetical protein